MKQVGKIYSAVDADELEVGDIVQVANCPRDYRKFAFDDVLEGIREDRFLCRFVVDDEKYPLAKLICPKKHKE